MSVTDDLLKLHKLREKGRLTDSEFARAKAAVLDASQASTEERVRIEERIDRADKRMFVLEQRKPWPRSLKVTALVVLALLTLLALPLVYDLLEGWLFSDGTPVWE